MEPKSVIDGIGEEITAIVTPVSICMLVVVCLVHGLTPHGSDSGVSPFIATSFYHEKSTDSAETKLGGALLNALIFIVAVAAITFVLVALFYFRCTKVIWGYMGFSGFTILALLGGILGIQIIQAASIPLDIITFTIVLWNFSVVGVLAVFFWKMPIFLKQGYLVFIGAVVAFWFTKLPEWTTWTVLAAMALYDLAAVLAPGGPLKLLVEMSIERDEDIPALIYEARPASLSRGQAMTSRGRQNGADVEPGRQRRRQRSEAGNDGIEQLAVATQDSGTSDLHVPTPLERPVSSPEVAPVSSSRLDGSRAGFGSSSAETIAPDSQEASREGTGTSSSGRVSERQPGVSGRLRGRRSGSERPVNEGLPGSGSQGEIDEGESAPLVGRTQREGGEGGGEEARSSGEGEEGIGYDEEEWGLPDAIKLGLGDFIFYSLLVGRAAMYDLMTVYACYLAIIAGLGATLVLLAVYRHALPALPISVALGMTFYFMTRIVVEPLVVGLATNLLFF